MESSKSKAKGKMGAEASSYGEKSQPFFKTKDGSVFPKKNPSVLKMMVKVVVDSTASYIDKTKNKHKTYPQDGSA